MKIPFLNRLLAGVRTSKPLATSETDPEQWILAQLRLFPNPDPILRKLGKAEAAYEATIRDAHVIGEVRAMRGHFRSWAWRLRVGNPDDAASVRAHQLCVDWMAKTQPVTDPSIGLKPDWKEIFWQMGGMSSLHGYRVHELAWRYEGGVHLPDVLDRPQRRIQFDPDGNPLLITRSAPMGEVVDDPCYFTISRHMADAVNPYGIPLLGACWPWYTGKKGGGRYLAKLAERHGLPWPVGKYPQSMAGDDAALDAFEQALAEMVENGYLLIPGGSESGIELLMPSFSGELPSEVLINRCNTEMSKALTSQSQLAELGKVGSRASADTADARQAAGVGADLDTATQSFNEVLRWVTLFNVGDVAPPVLEFFKTGQGGKERAETYQIAAKTGAKPSRKAMLDELGIPAAADDEDALLPDGAQPTQPPKPQPSGGASFSAAHLLPNVPIYQFAAAAGMTPAEAAELAAQAADEVIEDKMIAPVARMLDDFAAQGKTLDDAITHLTELTGQMDETELHEIIRRSLLWSMANGAATALDQGD